MAGAKRKRRLSRATNGEAQIEPSKRSRRRACIRSHYQRLSPQEKAAVRPFVFLDLPTELRLEIYRYLVIIPALKEASPYPGWSNLIMLDTGDFFDDMALPSLSILATCKQIHTEGQDLFYQENNFDVLAQTERPDLNDGSLGYPIRLPHPIKFEKLTNLRILVRLDPTCGLLDMIDWSILKNMTSLRSLDVAIAMSRLCPKHTPTSNMWESSLLLRGLIFEIVTTVPSSIILRFGAWKELARLMTLEPERILFIEDQVLQSILSGLESLRGSKAVNAFPKLSLESKTVGGDCTHL